MPLISGVLLIPMGRALKLLNVIFAMFLFASGLVAPIYARFVGGIGVDFITTGIAYSIFAMASGILMLVISKREDRAKHKEKVMAFGYGLSFVGYIGYTFVRAPIHLFVLELFFGIASAMETPAFDPIYSSNLSTGKFASEWGL